MIRKTIYQCFCLFVLLCSPAVWANNLTISDFFAADGMEMDASPVSCNEVESQAYEQLATLTVSASGDYEIADAGNVLGFNGTGQGIVDIVLSIYEDSFNPLDPVSNRVAVIDEGQSVPLSTGNNYVLVIQSYCQNTAGVFAIVIRGSGIISGAGFASDSYTNGQHSIGDDTADFPQGIGTHAYDVSGPVQVPQSGLYYFGDVGIYFNADLTLLAYEDSFDPANTSNNLAGVVSFSGSLNLDKDETYFFVAVDHLDLEGNWQFVLFPPGQIRFNETLKGSWVTPGVEGSGIMMEIGTDTGILFFAWFTFLDALPPVELAKTGPAPQSEQASSLNPDIGSIDQRWLTAFGAIPPDSNMMNIRYENTTGGLFNSTNPVPDTDSNYGIGTVEVQDCGNILITYDLAGGVIGSAAMVRIIPDELLRCLQAINAAAIVALP